MTMQPICAVELDVAQIVLGRLDLGRVLLGDVAQRQDVLVAEQRVVVEVHLAVEADELAVLGDDQRVDLEQAHVLLDEHAIEVADQLDALVRRDRPSSSSAEAILRPWKAE